MKERLVCKNIRYSYGDNHVIGYKVYRRGLFNSLSFVGYLWI